MFVFLYARVRACVWRERGGGDGSESGLVTSFCVLRHDMLRMPFQGGGGGEIIKHNQYNKV